MLADQRDAVEVALAVVGPPHRAQQPRGARLQRQVDVLAKRAQLGVRADHVLAHVLGMRARVADPLKPVDCVQRMQQPGEARWCRAQVAPVGVDVLPEQRDLAHPVVDHRPRRLEQVGKRAADLPPARRGHDAVGARAVAADADLQPALEGAGALLRQLAAEPLELEVPLRAQRVAGQELREPVDLARPERDIDEREAGEHLLLQRLRPAAPDPDHPRGILALQASRLPQVRHQPVVGGLADRAGVEQDQVGLPALRRLLIAERLEHPAHVLRVVLVHLAAERGHVVGLGHPLQR